MSSSPAETTSHVEALYAQRLDRYVTAMRNEQPDAVPVRPFASEVVAKICGLDCQQVTQDYEQAFEATRRSAVELEWDATIVNGIYVWGGIPQALATKYYRIPGVDLAPDVGFQYLEPDEGEEWMRADEYDHLIADPTGFLLEVWLPRTSRHLLGPGGENTSANNLAWLKGGLAMMQYFNSFPTAATRLRNSGVVSAIAGILKSPFDIIADKFRGYVGLSMDLFERPEKVKAAAEALMPHMLKIALMTADPDKQVPVSIWMHRGCVPLISPDQFHEFHWPVWRPIIEELWANGLQTLFYAEGKWHHHWDSFLELPAGSIIYHCDQDDVFAAKRALGEKFAISGGVPNHLLSFGAAEEVRSFCKRVIKEVASDGGYIMDAGALMQNDTNIDNLRAMTEAAREYGVYSRPASSTVRSASPESSQLRLPEHHRPPGTVVPWTEAGPQLGSMTGDERLVRNTWEDLDAWAYSFLWHCVVSF